MTEDEAKKIYDRVMFILESNPKVKFRKHTLVDKVYENLPSVTKSKIADVLDQLAEEGEVREEIQKKFYLPYEEHSCSVENYDFNWVTDRIILSEALRKAENVFLNTINTYQPCDFELFSYKFEGIKSHSVNDSENKCRVVREWISYDTTSQETEVSSKVETLKKNVLKLKKKLDEKSNSRSPLTKSIRHEVFKRDGYSCLECGRSNGDDGVVLHVDHIMPVSRGGSDEVENLQTLCNACNLSKSNRAWVGGVGND